MTDSPRSEIVDQAADLAASLLRLSCSLPAHLGNSPAEVLALMGSEFALHGIEETIARATIVRLTTAVALLAAERARALTDHGNATELADVIELVISVLAYADR